MRFARILIYLPLAFLFMLQLPLEAQQDDSNASNLLTDAYGRRLIPEIVNLHDGDLIPRDIWEQFDSRVIGESIVARIDRTMLIPNQKEPYAPYGGVARTSLDVANQVLIQWYFPREKLSEVLERGILNLHQASGIENQRIRSDWRSGIEDNLARLQIEQGAPTLGMKSSPNYLRPKSVILDVDLGPEVKYRTRGGQRFGDCVAVVKPQLLKRMTYTPFDSGAMGPENQFTDNNRLRKQVRTLTEGFLYYLGPFRSSGNPYYTEYFEGQIWGAVSLSDIQEIWIPNHRNNQSLDTRLLSMVPIFSYDETTENDRYRRIRVNRDGPLGVRKDWRKKPGDRGPSPILPAVADIKPRINRTLIPPSLSGAASSHVLKSACRIVACASKAIRGQERGTLKQRGSVMRQLNGLRNYTGLRSRLVGR